MPVHLLLAALLIAFGGMAHALSREIPFSDTSIPIEIVPSTTGEAPLVRLLWLPSEYGVLPQEKRLAQSLARHGVESWFPDLFEAWFLPVAPSSIPKIPAQALGLLIAKARAADRPLYVIGTDRGALLALRGWLAAQRRAGPLKHAALMLINPNLYVATPRPGQRARYWPETERLDAPVYLFQAELSPWRWRLKTLTEKLERGGSDIFVHLLRDVRDRFYFRPDATEREKRAAARFPLQLRIAMHRLIPWMETDRALPRAASASPAPESAEPDAEEENASMQRAALQPYEGPPLPDLRLQTLDGRTLSLNDLKGKVTLVNFWASWCPPCVHEMPSMAALKTALRDRPFEILAVNLAEERADIEAFLRQRPVNFPVLLDPSGQAIEAWRIFAYPSSYLLDKTGRIRYAAFGALDWNAPAARRIIRRLLEEPAESSSQRRRGSG